MLVDMDKIHDNPHFRSLFRKLAIGQEEILEFANSSTFDMYISDKEIDPSYASRKFIDSLRRE